MKSSVILGSDKNQTLIDGTTAKTLNNACLEYNKADTIYKDSKKSKDNARDVILDICNVKGVYETNKFVITTKKTEDSLTIDTEYLKKHYPDIYKECLIKPKKGSYNIANIKSKI